MEETRYFLTVSWCNSPYRGPFVNRQGIGYSSEEPHTEAEMHDILGPFWLILNPKSEPFTAGDLERHTIFHPLEEYQRAFGIAIIPEKIAANGV